MEKPILIIAEAVEGEALLRKGADFNKDREDFVTILVILLILWLLGFISQVGGSLIHILPVLAVIVLIYNVVVRRRVV